MTLDQAIRHCEQATAKGGRCACTIEHRQLAKWLRELKAHRKTLGGSPGREAALSWPNLIQ